MLSKDDYREYLNEMSDVERKMADFYKNMSNLVEDIDIKKLLKELSEQEDQHDKMVDELKNIFKT